MWRQKIHETRWRPWGSFTFGHPTIPQLDPVSARFNLGHLCGQKVNKIDGGNVEIDMEVNQRFSDM